MLIRYLTDLSGLTPSEEILYLVSLLIGGGLALWLHREGQRKVFPDAKIFPDGVSGWANTVWNTVFFLFTGALRTTPIPGDGEKKTAAKLWFSGFRFGVYGLAGSLLLYIGTQILLHFTGWTLPLLLIPRGLAVAQTSALLTGLLPLPGFDMGNLIQTCLPERMRDGFSKAGTVSFFLFTALVLALARWEFWNAILTFPVTVLG